MGSRLRSDPDHIFEVFIKLNRDDVTNPRIVSLYPENYEDSQLLESVPKFAFPFATEFKSNSVDHFTFAFTDIRGEFRFGFCRHTSDSMHCLCVISYFPWYEIFYRVLNHLTELFLKNDGELLVSLMLSKIYSLAVPDQGMLCEVQIADGENYSFTRPPFDELPSIPESRNMTEYYNAVDARNMVALFANMLCERRIIVTSRKLSRLTACIHAASSLLYPMTWQHLFIPALPSHLLEYCCAPMPYLIGIHSSLLESMSDIDLGDAVFLDADNNTLASSYDDMQSLPLEVIYLFKKHLKLSSSDKLLNTHLLGDGLAQAFLKVMVCLLGSTYGGYREALRFRLGHPIEFDVQSFIASRPPTMRPFLLTLLHLQAFEQFIGDRLEMLNADRGFKGHFEIEANRFPNKLEVHAKYSEWIKKRSKRLKREGKEIWGEMKDRGKKTVKDIKSCMDDFKSEEKALNTSASSTLSEGSVSISSPYTLPARPSRPTALNMSSLLGPSPLPRQQAFRRSSFDSAPTTPFDRDAPYRSLTSPTGIERFHSIKTNTSPVGSASPDDEQIYSNWQQRAFDLQDTIEESEDGNADDYDNDVGGNHGEKLRKNDQLTHSADDLFSYNDVGKLSLSASAPLDVVGSNCELNTASSDCKVTQAPGITGRRRLIRHNKFDLANSESVDLRTDGSHGQISNRADSCVTLISEEGYESSLCQFGDETFADSESADIISLDSGVLFSEQSSMSLESHAERDSVPRKQIVHLPRSGSGISRKKAFYNARRPDSINRRRSDERNSSNNDSVVSDVTIVGVDQDSSDSISLLSDSVVGQTAHDTASTALTTEPISDETLSSRTSSLTNVAGVYVPIGFRSSSRPRPVSFLSNRLSAIRVVEDT